MIDQFTGCIHFFRLFPLGQKSLRFFIQVFLCLGHFLFETSQQFGKIALQFVSTARVVAEEGTIEDSIVKLVLQREDGSITDNLEGLMKNLLRTHSDFPELKGAIFERLQQLVPSSQAFSVQQKKLIEDFMNIADLTERILEILRFYNEIRHLTDAMIRRYEILPQEELQPINFQEIKSELTTLYHLLQLMVKTPSDEVKMIDEHLTYLQAIVGKHYVC